MNAIGKRRLLKLAEFLETAKIPRKRFDMSTWAEAQGDSCVADVQLKDCGTAACACGWATTIPSFRKAGFRLVYDPDSPDLPDLQFGEDKEFAAVEAFFNLEECDATSLFRAEAYEEGRATPKRVAKRIRSFVAKHAAEVKSTRPVRSAA